MDTHENLKHAFADESQAYRKYLIFGEKAQREGFPQVAKLFRAIASAENIHANALFKLMDGVKGTLDNLEDAARGEFYDFEQMYPPMVATAKEEGQNQAASSLRNTLKVEEVHFGLFNLAIEKVKSGTDLPAKAIRICPVCGHTVLGSAPNVCPVCLAKGDTFIEVD